MLQIQEKRVFYFVCVFILFCLCIYVFVYLLCVCIYFVFILVGIVWCVFIGISQVIKDCTGCIVFIHQRQVRRRCHQCDLQQGDTFLAILRILDRKKTSILRFQHYEDNSCLCKTKDEPYHQQDKSK